MHQLRAYLVFMIALSRIRAWGLSREAANLLDQTGFPGEAATIRDTGNRLLMAGGSHLISGLSLSTTNSSNTTSSVSKTPISTPSASYPPSTSSLSSESLLPKVEDSLDVKPKPNETHPSPTHPHPLRRSHRLSNKLPLNKPSRVKPRHNKLRHNKKPPKKTGVFRYKRVKYHLRGIVRLRFVLSFFYLQFYLTPPTRPDPLQTRSK
jgi:hypothetical protein